VGVVHGATDAKEKVMPVKKVSQINAFKAGPPNERLLQMLLTPQEDAGAPDATILVATLPPHTGQTGVHTHTVAEVIFILSGRGEGLEGGKTFPLEPGTLVLAPAGVEHNCRNLSDEPMRMYCVFIPAQPDEAVQRIVDGAKAQAQG